jgi:hypothetical protein
MPFAHYLWNTGASFPVAYIENGQCDLVSRSGHTFRNFKDLARWIGENLRVESAVLDGEIACVDDSGRSVFNDLLFRRRECVFFAFDPLFLNGEDLRELPLIESKARLKRLLRRKRSPVLYVDHIEARGRPFFEKVVNSIWRASWRSGSRPPIERPRSHHCTGSRSRIPSIHKLQAATRCSIRSLTESIKFDHSQINLRSLRQSSTTSQHGRNFHRMGNERHAFTRLWQHNDYFYCSCPGDATFAALAGEPGVVRCLFLVWKMGPLLAFGSVS